jgi:adenylate cyclase, class 2
MRGGSEASSGVNHFGIRKRRRQPEGVSIETEVKIRIDDPEAFSLRLGLSKPDVLTVRHFEDNYLLDFHDRRLGDGQQVLRIRLAEGRGILTYKGPPHQQGIFKKREELETGIHDGAIALEVLKRVGMSVSFRYQKYRREFLLDGIHVAIDETPIGSYAELEGPEEGIRRIAEKLRIPEAQFIRSSYYSLYLDYCREKGHHPGNMVFCDDVKSSPGPPCGNFSTRN